jgi:hypothetical protein
MRSQKAGPCSLRMWKCYGGYSGALYTGWLRMDTQENILYNAYLSGQASQRYDLLQSQG